MVTILMTSAKMITLDLLKIKIFWNKVYIYKVIISVRDVTNKTLPRDSNYIADVTMWSTFDDSAFLWEKLPWPQCFEDLTRKTTFLGGGWSWFKFNNLELSLGITLKFYTSVAKNLKLKVLGTNFYVCRSYRGKTGSCSYVVPHHTPSRKGLSKFLSIKESLTESLT